MNQINAEGVPGLNIMLGSLFAFSHNADHLLLPCIVYLIESGASMVGTVDQYSNVDLYFKYQAEMLYNAIQERIQKITTQKLLFEKWSGRIAQAITEFISTPCINPESGLQNLHLFLNSQN